MKKLMRRFLKRFLLPVLALVLGYLAFNQIDARPYRSQMLDTPAFEPEVYEKTNCFYRLWTLTEPRNVDIETDAVILPYRRLFDPSFDNDHFIKEFIQNREAYLKKGEFPNASGIKFGVDWSHVLEQSQEQLKKDREEYSFMLARYEKMISCDRFIDLTPVGSDACSSLPWLRMAKFSMALDVMNARNGKALDASAHLLKQLQFAIEVNAKSRPLLTNLIAKAVARLAIWSLNDIMNQKDCPPQVFQLIYEKTEPLFPDQYGSSLPLVFDAYLWPEVIYSLEDSKKNRKNWVATALDRLFYQENRTRNIRLKYMESFILRAEIPPYQWSGDFQYLPSQTQGIFWWLQNPIGKQELDRVGMYFYIPVVFKSWALKTQHDMLHIAADLHRNFDPARSIQEQLNDLPSYRELLDPCSGKSYIWNEAKKLLYSIGIDRSDNQGEYKDWAVQNSDYALPIITNFK